MKEVLMFVFLWKTDRNELWIDIVIKSRICENIPV